MDGSVTIEGRLEKCNSVSNRLSTQLSHQIMGDGNHLMYWLDDGQYSTFILMLIYS